MRRRGRFFPALRATRFTFCTSAPDRRYRRWSNAWRVHFVQHAQLRSHCRFSATSVDEPTRQRGRVQHGLLCVLQLLIGETDVGPMLGVFNLFSTLSYDLTAVRLRCRSINKCDNGVAFPAPCATRFTLFVLQLLIGETDVGPMLGVVILSSTLSYDLTAVFLLCRSMNQCDSKVVFSSATRNTVYPLCTSAPDRRYRCLSNAWRCNFVQHL